MKFMKGLLLGAAVVVMSTGQVQADTVELIGGDIADGNGDFNYDGGGSVSGAGTATPNENIARDRYLIGSPNVGASVDIDGWTMTRLAYNGGNNSFGFDGNFGLDNEPANTGSGQAFTNGNSNTDADLIADQILFSGIAGDIFNLNYLLGSDGGSADATVTLTLDAGLGTEQVSAFSTVTRTGDARDGSTSVSETYTSTGAYSTVDLTLSISPNSGTRSLVDDVRLNVETIPEPGSMALLGLAGLGLATRRRR